MAHAQNTLLFRQVVNTKLGLLRVAHENFAVVGESNAVSMRTYGYGHPRRLDAHQLELDICDNTDFGISTGPSTVAFFAMLHKNHVAFLN